MFCNYILNAVLVCAILTSVAGIPHEGHHSHEDNTTHVLKKEARNFGGGGGIGGIGSGIGGGKGGFGTGGGNVKFYILNIPVPTRATTEGPKKCNPDKVTCCKFECSKECNPGVTNAANACLTAATGGTTEPGTACRNINSCPECQNPSNSFGTECSAAINACMTSGSTFKICPI